MALEYKFPTKEKVGSGPHPCAKVGDRVVLFKKNATPVRGSVRWTGKCTYESGKKRGKKIHEFNALGVETDVKVVSNEIETVRPPKTHVCTFTVGKDRGQVFVKAEQAMLERDFGGPQQLPTQLPKEESTANVHEKYEADGTLTVQQSLQQESKVLNFTEKEEEMSKSVPSALCSAYNHEHLMRQLHQQAKVEEAQKWEDKKRREEEQMRRMRREGQQTKVMEMMRKVKSWDEETGMEEKESKKEKIDWRPRAATLSAVPTRPEDQQTPHHASYYSNPAGQPGTPPPPSLEVGLAVRLAQDPSRTGVVRWVGQLPDTQEFIVGVELDGPMDGCGDGMWNGQQHFSCPPERACFLPVSHLELRSDEQYLSRPMTPAAAVSQAEHELRRENNDLLAKLARQSVDHQKLKQQVEDLIRENHHLKQTHAVEMEQLRREYDQHAIEQLQRQSQSFTIAMEEQKSSLEQRKHEVTHFRLELQQVQNRNSILQDKLERSAAEKEQMRPATELLLTAAQFKTASRNEVEVERVIGEGAWGVVKSGRYRGQQVAVKWPHLALLQEYPNTVDRMRREVNIMSQVRHPNLIRFIAAILDEDAEQLRAPPMIITELLDTNLRHAYRNGQLQDPHCIPILRDIAFALHYLHSHLQPIIHRDVSAPNILLKALANGGWLAKVTDFGSANYAKLSRTAGEGAIIYTAPEAFPHTNPNTKPPEITTKTDVYSYGILICEVLTRQPPFSENYRRMLQQLNEMSGYDLVVWCTKESPVDRPTMAEVLDELEKLAQPTQQQSPSMSHAEQSITSSIQQRHSSARVQIDYTPSFDSLAGATRHQNRRVAQQTALAEPTQNHHTNSTRMNILSKPSNMHHISPEAIRYGDTKSQTEEPPQATPYSGSIDPPQLSRDSYQQSPRFNRGPTQLYSGSPYTASNEDNIGLYGDAGGAKTVERDLNSTHVPSQSLNIASLTLEDDAEPLLAYSPRLTSSLTFVDSHLTGLSEQPRGLGSMINDPVQCFSYPDQGQSRSSSSPYHT